MIDAWFSFCWLTLIYFKFFNVKNKISFNWKQSFLLFETKYNTKGFARIFNLF